MAFLKKKTVAECIYEAILSSYRELVSLDLIDEKQPKNMRNDILYSQIVSRYHTKDLIKKSVQMNGRSSCVFQ